MPKNPPIVNAVKWIGLSIAVILLDQFSKVYCIKALLPSITKTVIPDIFDVAIYHNPGAAFSFLADGDGWQAYPLSFLAIVISLWLMLGIWKGQFQGILNMAAALVAGGAIGNLLDRWHYGYVIDFLVFHYHDYYFPAFNIADSAITVGALLFILCHFRQSKR